MNNLLPELWIDWCAVTGVDVDSRDEGDLERFCRQAGPSQRVLARLRPTEIDGPAWPRHYRGDDALPALVRSGTALIEHAGTRWIDRLRLRRLLAAGVLLAPRGGGGLGLTREQIGSLKPEQLGRMRPGILVTEDETGCPACALWSWLSVVGMNNGWSFSRVRELGHHRDRPGHGQHRHLCDDPQPDWFDSPALLPAIDRWGWIDPYAGLHPSSLSGLAGAIAILLDDPIEPEVTVAPVAKKTSTPRFSAEEEDAIHARADEILSRVRGFLQDIGDSS